MRENRVENVLAYMAAAVVGVSILTIVIFLVASLAKFALPPVLIILPIVGLPIGFVLVITLLILSIVRKSRAN
ncbi:MAG: hypothetical protein RJA35_550 [Actinomycetota bacterium]|jgi:hypothetical protein